MKVVLKKYCSRHVFEHALDRAMKEHCGYYGAPHGGVACGLTVSVKNVPRRDNVSEAGAEHPLRVVNNDHWDRHTITGWVWETSGGYVIRVVGSFQSTVFFPPMTSRNSTMCRIPPSRI